MANDGIQSLIIKLKAQGINVTEKQLRRLDGQAKKTGMSLKGMIAAAGGIYTIGRAFSYVIGVGKEFSSQQSNLASVLGTTRKALGDLDKTSRELGATTKFTAGQVTQLQTEFAKLGFSTDEIISAQEATLALAAATNIDLATAAETAGQMVNAFGLGAEQTDRVVNVMAASFSSSALDIEKFNNSMVYVSAVAKQSNISIEATTALLGKLADRGIDGSIAGTQLRQIFLKLSDSSNSLTKRLGFTVKSEEDLFKALKQLNGMGLSTTEMMKGVGVRAVSTFSNLLQMADGAEQLQKDITGTTKAMEMADEQMNNLEGDTLKLVSATEGFSIELYTQFEPLLRLATQALTAFMGFLDPAIVKGFIISLSLAGVAFVALSIKAKLASLGIKSASAAMKAFAASSGGLFLALTAISTVVVALSGGFEEQAETIEIATGSIEKAFARQGQAASHLSLDARRSGIDFVKVQEQIDASVMQTTLLSKDEYEQRISDMKDQKAQIEKEVEVIDVLNSVVSNSATIYDNLHTALAGGTADASDYNNVLGKSAKTLKEFNITNENAGKVLTTLSKSLKGEDSLEALIEGVSVKATKVGADWTRPMLAAGRDFRELKGEVKATVVDINSFNGATSKLSRTMDTNVQLFHNTTTGLDNMQKGMEKGSKYSKRIYGGIFGETRFQMIQEGLDNSVDAVQGFNKMIKDIDTKVGREEILRFQEIVDEFVKDGKVEISVLALNKEDREKFQTEIIKLEGILAELNDLQEVEAAELLAKQKESIGKIIDEDAKKLEAKKNVSDMMNIAYATEVIGLDKLSQAHINYGIELSNAEDANGNRLYTDDQVVLMLTNMGDELNKVTLAQALLNDMNKQAEIISGNEELAIINKVLALSAEENSFKATAESIDTYIASIKQAILDGKSFDEAVADVTGIDPEQAKKDEDQQKENQKMIQAFLNEGSQIRLDALNQDAQLKAEYDMQELEAEWEKIQSLKEFKDLQNSDDKESQDKLLQLQADYALKKKKIEQDEVNATAIKHQQMADSIAGWASAIGGIWSATGKNAELVTSLQYVEAIANTYSAASKAFNKFGGWPGGIAPAALTVAQGLGQVAQIKKARDEAKAAASKSVTAEYGANFITDGLTNLTVGDNPGGRELVNVVPLSSPNMFGDQEAGGGTTLNVNVSGNVMSKEFVEDELIETINEAIRQGNVITS